MTRTPYPGPNAFNDPELNALEAVVEQLEWLSPLARLRVIRYIWARYYRQAPPEPDPEGES